MATPSAASIALMVVLLVVPAVFATDYPISWTQGTYDDWGSDKTLVAGDTITFSYGASHSLNVVDKDTYDNCGSAAKSKLRSGSDKVTLVAGNMYFLCPQGNHCAGGMKLAVSVAAAGTPATPATPTTPTPTTPSTPTTPATPSTPTTPAAGTPATPKPTAPSPSAATSSNNMNLIVIGGALLLAPLFAFLG
ncbi:hypothetical protein MKW94_030273 [Papaver nudicaule]|uniref:Phytocyanin domain-containing protein n=1 Tax=Papaver nudicaule TaxID=74823 RepID=A0AA41S1D2_PAPNU|nr:hypothetical protein [Papaver nudicaule]